jgi:capsular polysaccharide biosynthesis protein
MMNVRGAFGVVRRRWFAVALTLICGLLGVLVVIVTTPKSYEAAAHVLIVSESGGRDPSVSTIDLPVVASSTVVLGRVLDRLHLQIPMIKLKKALKVRVGARSSIMEISYRDEIADRAVAVTNAAADELERYYEQLSSARADDTVRKLDVSIAAVRERLARINRKLAAERAVQPLLESDKAVDGLTERLDDLELQRQLAGAALISDTADAASLTGDPKHLSTVARHEMLQNDPLYRNLSETAARDGAELTTDEIVHTSNHPENAFLEPKVRGERASVVAEEQRFLKSQDAFSPTLEQNAQQRRKAQALITGDRARIAALDRVISDEQARLNELPRSSASYAWLRLQRDAAQADYSALAAHRTAAVASRAEALSLGSVVVFDRAVRADTTRVGLGRAPLAVACTLLVLLLSIVAAFTLEMMDPSLRRAEQFEALYGAPLLASLSGRDPVAGVVTRSLPAVSTNSTR